MNGQRGAPTRQPIDSTQQSAVLVDPARLCIVITLAKDPKSPFGQGTYLVENFVDNARQRRR